MDEDTYLQLLSLY
nr:unnamed protein product [Callosobruchus analis]